SSGRRTLVFGEVTGGAQPPVMRLNIDATTLYVRCSRRTQHAGRQPSGGWRVERRVCRQSSPGGAEQCWSAIGSFRAEQRNGAARTSSGRRLRSEEHTSELQSSENVVWR